MLNTVEAYLGLRRAAGFEMKNCGMPVEELCWLCGWTQGNACSHANGNRLGGSRPICGTA